MSIGPEIADHRQNCWFAGTVGYAAPLPDGMARPEPYEGPETRMHTRERRMMRLTWHTEAPLQIPQHAPVLGRDVYALWEAIAQEGAMEMFRRPMVTMIEVPRLR